MKDKIIQVSGFGIANTQDTQCNYLIVGVTMSGKVVITIGDGIWSDISPKASQPAVEADAESRCFFCDTLTQATEKGQACPVCGGHPA